jgi:tetratricopeptide (TPR) repeat protein
MTVSKLAAVKTISLIVIGVFSQLLESSSGYTQTHKEALEAVQKLNAETAKLYTEGQYEDATRNAEKSLEIAQRSFGRRNSIVADLLNNLALLNENRGAYQRAEELYRQSLLISEEIFGPNTPSVATSLNNLGLLYLRQGRYADAEPLVRRSLAVREEVLGPNHPDVASSLNNLATLYLHVGRFADAEPLLQRASAIGEKALGPDNPEVAKELSNLASLYRHWRRDAEAEPLLKRALAIMEKSFGEDHADVSTALGNLASLYMDQGRYVDAELLMKRGLAIAEKVSGPNHSAVALSLSNLAGLYRIQGRYAPAASLTERALEIDEATLGPNHPDVATLLNNLAATYEELDRHAALEPLYQRALAIREKAFGRYHPDVAVSLNNLATFYVSQGRYSDAEPLLRRALEINEKAFGSNHPAVATSLGNLAIVYDKERRYAEVEPLYQRALAIRETALGPDHPDVAKSLDNLSVLYGIQGRYADAAPLVKRALAINEKVLGPNHPDVAASLDNLGELYSVQRRYADAEPILRRALAIREKALNPHHPDLAQSLNRLAVLYDREGRNAEVEPLYKRALTIREEVLGVDHPDVGVSLNNLAGFYGEQGRYAEAYEYIKRTLANRSSRKLPSFPVLYGAYQSKLLTPEQSFADSFNVVQFASSSAAAEAVQQLAFRYVAGTNQFANLVRRYEDLIAENYKIDRALIDAASRETAQRNMSEEERMRARLAEIQSERLQITSSLMEKFPDYIALANPQPLTLGETQDLLADDEAVVVIDIGSKSYGWVVTKGDAYWTEIAVTSKVLNDQISVLRQSLTFAVDRPFDAALAYEVYQETFGPIASHFASKKRISVIANGALTSIPLQLLVIRDPTGKSLKNVDWLVKSAAITVLPSIYSLKTMRAQKPQTAAPKAMIAYADPVFSKAAQKEAEKVGLRSTRTRIDVSALAESLDPLPSTKDEVVKVGRMLNVPVSDIHTGLEATETAIKQAALDQYRIVYFATHALVAGDLESFVQTKAEPALVLTIPDTATDRDDGFLQASEVAELKLNADWVVLSACNTAAGDSVGAEALSGLARAFLYAGARSLVVSHWDVLDDATVLLMSELFRVSNQNKSISHAEALQQAQLDLLQNAKRNEDAHPRVWAPFVVVGEPAKQN